MNRPSIADDSPTSNPPALQRKKLAGAALLGAAVGAVFYYGVVLNVLYRNYPDQLIGRVMSSWVNLFSIMAFFAATASLAARKRQLRRESAGTGLNLVPGDDDMLVLPDDALECRRKIRDLPVGEQSLLPVRLMATAVQRARANWSAQDVADAVRNEADLVQAQTDSLYSNIRYLAWTIPPIGFIGTVLGIGDAIGALTLKTDDSGVTAMNLAAEHLHVAFDTTFVALVLSLVLMFYLSRVQADEDDLLTSAVERCLRRFVFRMHIPQGQPS